MKTLAQIKEGLWANIHAKRARIKAGSGERMRKPFSKGAPTKDQLQTAQENFQDGRNPQDKGDSARHGIPKKATIAQLMKIRSSETASPRKKQLAHWQINMRRGKMEEGASLSYNKPDEQTGVMSYHDLEAHIGRPKALMIAKHQQFQKHISPQISLGAQVGFKFERRHGFESVYAVHGPNKYVDKEKPGYRTMLRFHLSGSGKKVTQVDRSVNHNNERHREGSLVWDHRETWEHPVDKRENKRLAKVTGGTK